MPAKINSQGIWTRNVPAGWIRNGIGRSDIFKSTLSNARLRHCRFVFENGPTVTISVNELRRVVEGGIDHYDDKIWGPFDIDPEKSTLDGHQIQLEIS